MHNICIAECKPFICEIGSTKTVALSVQNSQNKKSVHYNVYENNSWTYSAHFDFIDVWFVHIEGKH